MGTFYEGYCHFIKYVTIMLNTVKLFFTVLNLSRWLTYTSISSYCASFPFRCIKSILEPLVALTFLSDIITSCSYLFFSCCFIRPSTMTSLREIIISTEILSKWQTWESGLRKCIRQQTSAPLVDISCYNDSNSKVATL
jgi:hypothetical protein